MRRGARRVEWTTEDLRYLREKAGTIPLRQICRHLKRSTSSVVTMASYMRLSLRCPKSKLKWCTRCASYRLSLGEKTGHCRVCAKRDQLARAKERTAEAYAALSAQDKELYAKTLTSRMSVPPPRPKPPAVSVRTQSRYERQRAEERYAEEVERWEIKRLDKLINTEKTLLKRMRLRTNSNPRKKSK